MKCDQLGVWTTRERDDLLKNYDVTPELHGGVWEFRPFINLRCNYRCSLPRSGHLFCHTIEEMPEINHALEQKSQIENSNKIDLFCGLFAQLRRAYGINQIKIAGMEPTLCPELPAILNALFEQNPTRISLTTNGSRLTHQAEILARTGLINLTVSLHSLHPAEYNQLTSGGNLSNVLEGIQKALDAGFQIKINHLLLNKTRTPLEQMMAFCRHHELELKLYQLIWNPQLPYSRFQANYVNPVTHVTSLLDAASHKSVKRFQIPNRDRWRIETPEGLPLTFDLFASKTEVPSFLPCASCCFRVVCQEGYLGYGLEMTPTGIVTTCGLRQDLAIDLSTAIASKKSLQQVLTVRQDALVFVPHLVTNLESTETQNLDRTAEPRKEEVDGEPGRETYKPKNCGEDILDDSQPGSTLIRSKRTQTSESIDVLQGS